MTNINTKGLFIPKTPEQKLKVLVDAREKLEAGWSQYKWAEFVNGTASYCLYGAIEAAMGYDFAAEWNRELEREIEKQLERTDDTELAVRYANDAMANWEKDYSNIDDLVSGCSLTKTMFYTIRPDNVYSKIIKLGNAQDWSDSSWGSIYVPYYYASDMSKEQQRKKYYEDNGELWFMVAALQDVNDNKSKEDVLAIVDKTIESLKAETEAS